LRILNQIMENQNNKSVRRLYSLDALRGFDMFWIMGGGGIFIALANLTDWPIFQWWAKQLHHVPWHGFHFLDLIFPLFLFIAGISFPFSLVKRRSMNVSEKSIYVHIIKRALILVFLGILYVNAVKFDFTKIQYSSVLGRIGLAWMFAAFIFMNTSKFRSRILWLCGLLIGYWLLLLLFPAHDLGSIDPFSKDGNLAGYVDRLIMPGKLLMGIYTPQGFLSTIPSIGIPLLGMLTGEFLLSGRFKENPMKRVAILLAVAVILLAIGLIWNTFFPINKNLWTSSFICVSSGLSLLLFAVFYLIIDVWQYRKWSFFFAVIGMNPITIYLIERIINFKSATTFFFGGLENILPQSLTPLIDATGLTIIAWGFLYILYKKKIFLKI